MKNIIIADFKEMLATNGGPVYIKRNFPEIYHEDGFEVPGILLLPLENEVFFPYLQVATFLDQPDAIAAARKAYKSSEPIFFFLASDSMPKEKSLVEQEDVLYSRGCIARIASLEEVEDKLLVSAVMWHRGAIMSLSRKSPYLRGNVMLCPAPRTHKSESEVAVDQRIEDAYGKLIMHLAPDDKKQIESTLGKIEQGSVERLSFIMQNSPLDSAERYSLLEQQDLSNQRAWLADHLELELEQVKIKSEMAQKAAAEIGRHQREEFLRNQMNQIRQELGEGDDVEIMELRKRAAMKAWNDQTKMRFDKELGKLQRYNPATADYAVQYSYLDTYLDLPWEYTESSDFTLDEVRRILDRDHYGLDKVKERIVEQMALLKLRNDTKAPILCLYGPPGVGKTSLGQSIAEALGRKYVRVALGGLHDEAEIRGHRRTYLGSMPGRILTALAKCGTSDPVMVLDEIDKIGADYKGDPSQALLEVLDPEQHDKFHDNYIDQDYDLSKVLFIATANTLSTISAPLLDRMELLEVTGYVEDEKVEIAKRHLLRKCLKDHGFEEGEVAFDDGALRSVIRNYTRESGVRSLEKKISKILRKLAILKADGKEFGHIINAHEVEEMLGLPEAFSDVYEGNEFPGVVTGLAWTQAGGEILFVESSVSPGKEGKLTLTGNLGDVMKESAVLALQYVRANHKLLNIPEENLEFGILHVHVPEGAVPKDGPSAGITIVTSLASTFTGRRVREALAMTGEITLRGKLLPVGGIKEKILAAKRAGIKTVLMSSKNIKDIKEIKPEYLEGLEFKFVDTVAEALNYSLLPAEEDGD